MATAPGGTVRELADDPVHFDHDDFQGIVSDAADAKITKDNNATSTAAGLVDEMKAVIAEAVEEARKLGAAEKNLYDATIAFTEASTPAERETARKGVLEAMDALDAARAEYERRETEILAKIADILARMDGISDGDGSPTKDSEWDEEGNPKKPKSDKPSSDNPDSPSSDSPSSDSPSSDSPGQTKLSSDTATPTTQQPQQAQVQASPQQAQQQQPSMSPSMGMPQQQQPSVSPSAFNVRPRSDKDKDKPKPDTDLGAMPVATPVPAAVPIDRGSSGTGITTRDVSGKPSTSLSTSGQVPGAANANNVRGGGVGGGMMGGAPIGGGSKADTSAKRSSKRFDIESLFKPDDNDQSVNSGSLSRDSLAATEKAREDEKNRMQEAMRESVKRLMNKKAG